MKKLCRQIDSVEFSVLEETLKENCFNEYFGTFVTLRLKGQLRGCIGTVTASEPIKEVVMRNAISASFHDPRFSPLSIEELENVEIEVNILSQPELLEYTDADDLIAKLRVNIDGVIIQQGSASATFLPQVWKQLLQTEEFLSHLCLKAGLPAEIWRTDKLEVRTYQVQYFSE